LIIFLTLFFTVVVIAETYMMKVRRWPICMMLQTEKRSERSSIEQW
jgi:hypothetical protein